MEKAFVGVILEVLWSVNKVTAGFSTVLPAGCTVVLNPATCQSSPASFGTTRGSWRKLEVSMFTSR